MKVVYFEQHLDLFGPPKLWMSSLGWKPENDATEARSRLDISLLEEESRIRIDKAGLDHPTNLSVLVHEEKIKSDAFEETLKQVHLLNVVSNSYIIKHIKLYNFRCRF